jgi:predicted nucleotidyltransferase
MKRQTTLRKVRTFCERLDAMAESLPVRVLSVHIFGSVLTDKPTPADIDLLVEYQERPVTTEQERTQALVDLWTRRPTLFARAVIILTRGLSLFRVVPYGYGSGNEPDPNWNAQRWAEEQMGKAVSMRMLWKPGFDWCQVIEEIEQNPLSWNGEAERERKKEIAERHPSTTAPCPVCNRRHSYAQNTRTISRCLEGAVRPILRREEREGLFFMRGPIPPMPVPSWPAAPGDVREELTALRRRRKASPGGSRP